MASLKTTLIISGILAIAVAQAETVSFYSGMGGGATDPSVTTLSGSASGGFAPLTSGDFLNANVGSNAIVLSDYAGGWIHNLPMNASAQWIGVDATGGNNSYNSHSALYDMSFQLANNATDAMLHLDFSVDDSLGDANNQGLFIDGSAIAGSKSNVDWNGVVESKNFDLGALSAGTHHLYFDVLNSGAGPSGVIYSGTIQSQAVPEPASFAALAVAAAGLVRRKKLAAR